MGFDKVIKKFASEPFTWICLAMVGVVLLGPTAANLARKVAGGDRNRGNIDEHGESINHSLPIEPKVHPSDQMTDVVNSHQQQRPVTHVLLPNEKSSSALSSQDHPGSASKKMPSAVDTPAEAVHHPQQTHDTATAAAAPQEGSSTTQPSNQNLDRESEHSDVNQMLKEHSFDVDQMVEDVKREVNADATDHELPSGSDTKAVDRMKAETSPSSTGKHDPADDEFLPLTTEMNPLPPANLPQSATGTDNGFTSPPLPNLPEPLSNQMVDEENNSVFTPWDEPLKFTPDSGMKHLDQSPPTKTTQPPSPDAISSIAPESGGTWWDATIAQQFWPERQVQLASIDTVVFSALQNSAQIQILNDRPHIEETFVQQREADFDWSAFVDASWNSIDEPIRSELQTGSRTGRFVQEELSVSSGLQKRLGRGGELRVGSSIGTVDNNSVFLAPPDQGTATFSLDYRQPLLRGRGREITKSQIVLARLNVEASAHSVKQQMQEYLVEVVTAYWDLYRARGALSQRHRNHLRATEIVQQLSNPSSSKMEAQLQRALAAAGARHSEVIDAEYIVADAQERLMNLTHSDNLASSNEIEIIPTDAAPQSYASHDLNYVTQLAVQNRAEVKEVLAEIKLATVRQVIALDGLKPQLDAIISSYVAGVRGNKDVGNAIVDQFSAGDPSYSVGLSFEVPIGRRSANAATRREAIHRRMLENKLRKTLGDVSMSARSAFRDVYRLMAMTESNRQVVAQSVATLNSIQRDVSWLQKDDPSTALFLNDLLASQDRLAQAEQNLLDTQAQLAIAHVRLKRATGELLQDNTGVHASEGCATCDSADVTQATWNQPAEQFDTIIENERTFIDDVRDVFQPSRSQEPAVEQIDLHSTALSRN